MNLPARRGPGLGDWIRGSLFGWTEDEPFEHQPLLATKQRLGILPSLAFWTRRITWKVQLPAFFVALGATAALGLAGLGAAAGALGIGAGLLTLGGIERKVRQQMLARGLKAAPDEEG